MSVYRLDIKGHIGLSEYSTINDYFAIVNDSDTFTINLNKESKEDLDIICNMLQNSDFHIKEKGGNYDDRIFIKASKNKH
ncbi:hypothetical protein [Clostridium grantii]|uniref:Uncharacterized protein n=1 Tax=Clostridium grantii DSM 8605 TaxID=1121316 RepID=A0A1M5WJE5_9CLOT|nr:hypothetical protein [Clostridium grantii]SHH87679.1 hypothetical protein SAMN02745207_02935 [Clostridium grantii DSM 8605]